MEDNVTTDTMLDEQILVPVMAGTTGESLVQLALQLAAGSDRRSGVLAFTVEQPEPTSLVGRVLKRLVGPG